MPAASPPATGTETITPATLLELEVTGRCQLACTHCCTDSGPASTDGTMTLGDWVRVIDQAAATGTRTIQFINGEPTLYAGLPTLIHHTLGKGLEVEVFSNLVHLTPTLWALLERPGVRLATSWYSDDPDEHTQVTGRPGSYHRTLAHIGRALARGIPLRVGIITLRPGQRVGQARGQLAALGVRRIRIDRARAVGRAAAGADGPPSVEELCGGCGQGRATVAPDGTVTPCLLGRWMHAGNVHDQPLPEILSGQRWAAFMATIPRRRAAVACNPSNDGDDCAPAEGACSPRDT